MCGYAAWQLAKITVPGASRRTRKELPPEADDMPVKVLIVDDSLFMRRLVSDVLGSDPGIQVVGTAKDGADARKAIRRAKPDCVTLDLVMPGEDGLSILKHIMVACPTPVVILSAHSRAGADITMKCLEGGAAGFVPKPSGEVSLDIDTIKPRLIREVKAAARLDVRRVRDLVRAKPAKPRRKAVGTRKLVVVGASTGGPQTLGLVLSSLPASFPGAVVVVQHMPAAFFTESLAERLNQGCELAVQVAANGEIIKLGKVYLAPGGYDITLRAKSAGGLARRRFRESGWIDAVVRLHEAGPDDLSPSIDTAMKSAARAYGRRAVGVILSGLGHDGRDGMAAVKAVGGRTIVQDESSLIFGMPKAVIDSGHADEVLPPQEIGRALMAATDTGHQTVRTDTHREAAAADRAAAPAQH